MLLTLLTGKLLGERYVVHGGGIGDTEAAPSDSVNIIELVRYSFSCTYIKHSLREFPGDVAHSFDETSDSFLVF